MARHRWGSEWASDEGDDESTDTSDETWTSYEARPRNHWRVAAGAAVAGVCVALGWVLVLVATHDWAPPAVTTIELSSSSEDAPPTADGTPRTAGSSGSGEVQDPAESRGSGDGKDAAAGTESDGPQASGPPEGSDLVVHVAGAIHRPGVVQAPAGSRVHQVVELAGGALPEANLDAINLAASVQDGQQLYVPVQGETAPAGQSVGAEQSTGGVGAAGSAAGPGPGGGSGLINLNTATTAQLATLPRIGPVLAERIVAWRNDHGRFQRVDDLDAVPGIGPTLLEGLRALVVV